MTLPFPSLPSITIFSKMMAGALGVRVWMPSAVIGLFVSFWLFMRFLYVFFLKCFVFSEKSINFAT